MNAFIKEIVNFINLKTGLGNDEILPLIETPTDEKYGDYALPCFKFAKILKTNPKQIAEKFAEEFPLSNLIIKCTAINGYINFYINREFFIKSTLSNIIGGPGSLDPDKSSIPKVPCSPGSSDPVTISPYPPLLKGGEGGLSTYGDSTIGSGKTVIIDFSSPNIAKPFSIAHLRSTSIGNSIYLLHNTAGYNCVRVNHLGDWGTQFGKLIIAYQNWGNEDELAKNPIQSLLDLYVRFHKEEENTPTLSDSARAAFKRLEDGNQEELELWKRFKELSLNEFHRIYDILGIEFDSYAGESFYNEMIPEILNELKTRNLTQVSEDALIIDLKPYDLPPFLLVKKDDATLYATRDICAAIYRYRNYNFLKNLYVVGHQQELHFKQLFKALELMGYEWVKNCEHISFGMMSFQDETMSTRQGKVIFLEDVLNRAIELVRKIIEDKNPSLENKDEIAKIVGIGAIIFSDLSSRRERDVSFKWEEILNFDGRTGPYVQYTYVRIQSILRKYGVNSLEFQEFIRKDFIMKGLRLNSKFISDINFDLLNKLEEFSLCRMLDDFPEKVNTAREEYEPAIIANYILDLCELFNNYYQKHRVISEDKELTKARILLIYCIGIVIKKGLYLLGIKVPEKM